MTRYYLRKRNKPNILSTFTNCLERKETVLLKNGIFHNFMIHFKTEAVYVENRSVYLT